MANKKFTELPQADTITGAEVLAMVQGGVSVQGDIDLIKAYFDTLYSTMVYTAPASVTPTFTGFGTVSGLTAYTWRIGALLFFEYRFTAGTVTASEARAGLRYNPGGGEVDVTTVSTYPTLQNVGSGAALAVNGAAIAVLAEASKTYVCFGHAETVAANGLVKVNGNDFTSSQPVSISGCVRVQGW